MAATAFSIHPTRAAAGRREERAGGVRRDVRERGVTLAVLGDRVAISVGAPGQGGKFRRSVITDPVAVPGAEGLAVSGAAGRVGRIIEAVEAMLAGVPVADPTIARTEHRVTHPAAVADKSDGESRCA